jgi:hypothetical protein
MQALTRRPTAPLSSRYVTACGQALQQRAMNCTAGRRISGAERWRRMTLTQRPTAPNLNKALRSAGSGATQLQYLMMERTSVREEWKRWQQLRRNWKLTSVIRSRLEAGDTQHCRKQCVTTSTCDRLCEKTLPTERHTRGSSVVACQNIAWVQ